MRARLPPLRMLPVLLGVAVASAATAQTVAPILIAASDAPRPGSRLQIVKVAVEAEIAGGFAQTSITLTFRNPGRQAIAGDLIFPLPERAVLSGYALDVNGVAVDRQRARVVFERIVRQGIDPGLVEWLAGNNFRTRVFPIRGGATRTIRVDYVAELEQIDAAAVYRLPLHYDVPIEEFSLRVEVVASDRQPEVRSSPVANLGFDTWRDSWVAETRRRDLPANRELRIDVPDTGRGAATVQSAADGETYFVVRDRVELPATLPRIAPRHVALYWDASMSRAASDNARLIGVLQDFFARDARDATVDLHVFRDRAEPVRQFDVRSGRATELLRALRATAYDGATQLGALAEPAAASEFAILVSDGHSNFGEAAPAVSSWPPIFALAARAGANHALLRQLAAASGGAYINLSRLADAEARQRIGATPYRLISIQVLAGDVSALTPTAQVVESNVVSVAGRLESRSAQLVLSYGFGARVVEQRTHAVARPDPGGPASGEVARLVWALNTLRELEPQRRLHRARISQLGHAHGLVTPETSLIVLESVDQYVEHQIRPPASLAAMRSEYDERVAASKRVKDDRRAAKIEAVVAAWQQRKDWWETDFSRVRVRVRVPKPQSDEISAARDAGNPDLSVPVPDAALARELEPSAGAEADALGARLTDGQGESAAADDEQPGEVSSDPVARGARIALEAWDPQTPYLDALRSVRQERETLYAAYLGERTRYGATPAFYLDVGDYFVTTGFAAMGLRVWSNLAELELESPALLRVLAHRLAQRAAQTAGGDELLLRLSQGLFHEVLELRPEEPQSHRDLALVLADLGDGRRALELLWEVVVGEWDRFGGIEQVAVMEINNVLRHTGEALGRTLGVDPRLIGMLDTDLRVVLTWDADLTDMDLWVTEATGEKVYYGNPRSAAGGFFAHDFTQGYGPEEYLLHRARPGTYLLEVDYFGSNAPTMTGSVILQVDVFTNYGRPNEERQSLTAQLGQASDTLTVGSVKM